MQSAPERKSGRQPPDDHHAEVGKQPLPEEPGIGHVERQVKQRQPPKAVGQDHYTIATEIKKILTRYQELQDVIAILGLDELNDADRRTVMRARRIQQFLTQPFFSTEQFTGLKGVYISLEETLRGFNLILQGRYDHLPEQAFYMTGTIDDVIQKAQLIESEQVADAV